MRFGFAPARPDSEGSWPAFILLAGSLPIPNSPRATAAGRECSAGC